MNNIFDVLDFNFFQIFSGENRRIYAEILMVITHYFNTEKDITINKEELIKYLVEYINNRGLATLDEDDRSINLNSREFVIKTLNKLKKYQWLDEDIIQDYEVVINFQDEALHMINAFEEILSKDKPLEYAGYLYTINATLVNSFEFDQAYTIIEQVYKNVDTLIKSLKGINSKIKRYLNKFMKDSNLDPKEILELLLVRYQDEVIDRAFKNLKTIDNPSKYRGSIIEKIESLYETESLKKIIKSYFDKKGNGEPEDEVQKNIISKLDFIYKNISFLNRLIDLIDSRNTKYSTSVTSRFKFLVNESYDVSGKIESVLKNMKNCNQIDIYENAFSLEKISILDDRSLREPHTRTERVFNDSIITKYVVDENKVDEIHEKIFEQSKFTVREIDQFVLKILENKERLKASEIDLVSIDEVGIIMLIEIYSSYEDMSYRVNFKDDLVQNQFVRFQDFEIIKR